MSVELATEAAKTALGLSPKQVKLLIRVGWVLLVSAIMMWVTGAFAFMGMGTSPYASAGEVKELRTDVTSIKVQLLEQSLFDVRLRQCKAETIESKQYYYERLQEKMNLYFHLTDRNWNPPDCKEIS
jgi:hypothetical protein